MSIRTVVKRFGPVQVIHGLSIEVRDGEFLVFVGPSGCGKSTLLRMVAGLESFEDGEIAIGERVVNAVPARDRDIAMVFQDYALYPHMTVEKNISFGLRMRGIASAEITERVGRAAAILQIDSLMARKPRELSGGQRQRVAMGRAIVRDPAVFLFDEPLSNLDAKLRVDMRVEIKRLHKALGTTMIYVTHDQVEAMTMADRIVVLRDGRIEQIGTPKQIYADPASRFVAGFIGSPAMNLLEADIEGASARLADGQRLPVALRGGRGEGRDDGPGGGQGGGQGGRQGDGRGGRQGDGRASGRGAVGIRPEHLRLAGEDGASGALEVVADVVEPLGADTLVTAAVAGTTVTARLPGDAEIAPGTRLRLAVEPGRALAFGPEGERL